MKAKTKKWIPIRKKYLAWSKIIFFIFLNLPNQCCGAGQSRLALLAGSEADFWIFFTFFVLYHKAIAAKKRKNLSREPEQEEFKKPEAELSKNPSFKLKRKKIKFFKGSMTNSDPDPWFNIRSGIKKKFHPQRRESYRALSYCLLKGTVQRHFRPPVFFHIRTSVGHWSMG